jgi:nucleotide-binding universal stress UspA family protein
MSEDVMSKETNHGATGRTVVVTGVDLSDVSEHLLAKVRDLVRSPQDAELHVVHVVHPEPLRQRFAESMYTTPVGELRHIEYAHWELERLCGSIVPGWRVFVHTPVGHAAEELTRIARDVAADVIVIQAHDHRGQHRVFHRSVVARISRTAPCSVLTIRDHANMAQPTTPEPDFVAAAP